MSTQVRQKECKGNVAFQQMATTIDVKESSTEFDSFIAKLQECAERVHAELGHNHHESIYQGAFEVELQHAGIRYSRQVSIPVKYRGHTVGHVKPDLIIYEPVLVVIELKAINKLSDAVFQQRAKYDELLDPAACILINFGQRLFFDMQ